VIIEYYKIGVGTNSESQTSSEKAILQYSTKVKMKNIDEISPFPSIEDTDSLFLIKSREGKFGVIDAKGKLILPIECDKVLFQE